MEGKLVIPAEEMVEKVRAAVEARTQPEFMIIARTDARAGVSGGHYSQDMEIAQAGLSALPSS
jgi:2-methylisocitrate lyase-like PEP mutase family enzyme